MALLLWPGGSSNRRGYCYIHGRNNGSVDQEVTMEMREHPLTKKKEQKEELIELGDWV